MSSRVDAGSALGRLLEMRVAAGDAESTAVLHPSGDVNHADLAEAVQDGVTLLHDAGLRRGDVVGAVVDDGPEWIAVLLATFTAGGVFLPLDPSDDRERRSLVAAARPRWLFGSRIPPGWRHESAAADPIEATMGWRGVELAECAGAPSPGLDDDVAYLVPTSGSTGSPALILGSRRGLAHFVDAELDLLGHRPWRVSRLTPPTFDVLLRDVFLPLCSGGTLCLPAPFDLRLDPRALAAWLQAAEVEVVHCVPTILRALARELGHRRLDRLRWLLVAGEPLFGADVRPWLENSSARVVNVYGPSETTLAKFFHVVEPADADRDRLPVGTPIAGAKAIVLDSNLEVCAPGIVGEIYIRTRYRSHGYYGNPALTAARFVPNPLGRPPGEAVFRTGDLGLVRPDGRFVVVGRADNTVKIRGMRVDLDLIEERLRAHPAVSDAATRVWRDADNNAYVCAYASLREGVSRLRLRRWLVERLPQPMVPAAIQLLDAIPRTSRGKVDRAALTEPDASAERALPPRTPLEATLSSIWEEVLPRGAGFGVEDDFQLAGGQSIHAAQVVARIGARLGVQMPLRTFLDLGTIESIAEHVEGAHRPAARGGGARFEGGAGDAPVSYAQRRFWRMLAGRPGDPSFHYLWLAEIQGPLDARRLAAALDGVVARHPATRTVFRSGAAGEEPLQGERALMRGVLEHRVLTPRADASDIAREWARRRFALDEDPLLRACLFELGEERHALALAGHVIVSDGQSKSVLLDELGVAYREGVEALPPPPASFAQYARWERGPRGTDLHSARLDYWRDVLPKRLEPPGLPHDFPLEGGWRTGTWLRAARGQDVRTSLAETAREEGVSEVAVLLSCFADAVEGWAGLETVPILIPIPNRLHEAEERVVGCFTETALLRLEAGASGPKSRERTNRLVLDALDNAVPFDWLMERLYPGVDTVDGRMFPIMFAPQPDLSSSLDLEGCATHETSGTSSLGGAVFDVHLMPTITKTGVVLSLGFDDGRFDHATADALLSRTCRALEGLGLERNDRR